MIAATYINEVQFSIEGNQLASFGVGQQLTLDMDTDGDLVTSVVVIIYDPIDDETVITINENDGEITSNLLSVERGLVDTATTGIHDHTTDRQGGSKAFSGFTDTAKVTRLNAIASLSAAVGDFIQCINSAGTDVEKRELLGTTNQVSIDFDTGTITISLPQDIDTSAVVEFANAVLSTLSGIVVAGTGGELTSINPSAGNQVVRKNVANTGFEAVDFALRNMKDVVWNNPSDLQTLSYSVSADKLVFTTPSGGSGGGGSVGLMIALASMFSGSGESENTTAVTDLDGDRLPIDWTASSFIPTDVTETENATQLAAYLKGIDLSLLAPDRDAYTPTPFIFHSDSQIKVKADTYYAMGYRHRGRYEKRSPKTITYGSDLTVTVSSAISGGLIQDSWYAVFATNPSSPSCSILPFIRVKNVTYNAPDTRIYIGKHTDYATAENGFVTTNDLWNAYRVVKISFDDNDGTVWTILDTVNTTGDYITVSGDQTSKIAAGDWLMLIPATTVDFCYLGVLQIDSGWTVQNVMRKRGTWDYAYSIVPAPAIEGNLSTDPANTELVSGLPPNAESANLSLYVSSGSSAVNTIEAVLLGGNSDSVAILDLFHYVPTAALMEHSWAFSWVFTAVGSIRNTLIQDDGSSAAADSGEFYISSFSE